MIARRAICWFLKMLSGKRVDPACLWKLKALLCISWHNSRPWYYAQLSMSICEFLHAGLAPAVVDLRELQEAGIRLRNSCRYGELLVIFYEVYRLHLERIWPLIIRLMGWGQCAQSEGDSSSKINCDRLPSFGMGFWVQVNPLNNR